MGFGLVAETKLLTKNKKGEEQHQKVTVTNGFKNAILLPSIEK